MHYQSYSSYLGWSMTHRDMCQHLQSAELCMHIWMLWNETYHDYCNVLLATVVTKPSLQPNIGTLMKYASMDLVFDISFEGFQTLLSFNCANCIERLSAFKSRWKDFIYKLNAHKCHYKVIITHTFSPRCRLVCLFI